MPLKIELKAGEKAIVNGAVLEGAADGRTEFVLLNKATVLRERHILQEANANSPVKRLYFAIQMLYIEPTQTERYLALFEKYHADLENTLSIPTVKFALEQINHGVKQGDYYESLKIARAMMETEDRLFALGSSLNKSNTAQE